MAPEEVGLKAIPMVHDPRAGTLPGEHGFDPILLAT